jgi:2-oxoglutarate/2-oxoacid ferredoxin oxidoreductase subunit beta
MANESAGGATAVKTVYKRPALLKPAHFHYCPGCGHGIINRLLMEVIEEMGLAESAICVAPAGCGMLLYNYFEIDVIESAHGRGSAVATGIKRILPDNLVFSYQGDGDLAAIGTAEGFHAANRGENITVIFVNNGVYGMTGGQMAPTTLIDQVTTTSPGGRNSELAGHPVRICEVFAVLDGTSYLERVAVNKPSGVTKTKRAIRKAFQRQLDGGGFSLVEILSPCPTAWKMDTLEACAWVDEVMSKQFPLGVIKDVTAAAAGRAAPPAATAAAPTAPPRAATAAAPTAPPRAATAAAPTAPPRAATAAAPTAPPRAATAAAEEAGAC